MLHPAAKPRIACPVNSEGVDRDDLSIEIEKASQNFQAVTQKH